MVTAEILRERRKRLSDALKGRAILLANDGRKLRNCGSVSYPFRGNSNFVYFCGNQPPGAIFLLENGKSTLFLESVTPDHAIWNGRFPDIDELAANYAFDKVLPRNKIVNSLVMYSTDEILTLPTSETYYNKKLEALIGAMPNAATRDRRLAQAMVAQRLIHDAANEKELRIAADIAVEVHLEGVKAISVSANERDVFANMQAAIIRKGMGSAFEPVVTTAGEILHNTFVGNELNAGDVLLVDLGVETPEGIASDITRCYPVSGQFTDNQKRIYQTVLSAQQAALELVKPGVRFQDVHLQAARVISEGLIELGLLEGDVGEIVERGAYSLFMPHGIGHLVGLDVHDMEDLGDIVAFPDGRERSTVPGLNYLRLDRDLMPGMCVTVEPGIYFNPAILENPKYIEPFKDCLSEDRIKDFSDVRGIRIEDECFVTDNGHDLLTAKLPKNIDEVEKLVSNS